MISAKVHVVSRKNIFNSLIHCRTTGNCWSEDVKKRTELWSEEVKDMIGQQCIREWQQAALGRYGLNIKATPLKNGQIQPSAFLIKITVSLLLPGLYHNSLNEALSCVESEVAHG